MLAPNLEPMIPPSGPGPGPAAGLSSLSSISVGSLTSFSGLSALSGLNSLSGLNTSSSVPGLAGLLDTPVPGSAGSGGSGLGLDQYSIMGRKGGKEELKTTTASWVM